MAAVGGRVSVIWTILIFVLFGPPIGYTVFLIWLSGAHWLSHGRLMPDLGSFLMFFPFSYLLGIIPAIVAGAIVAVIEARSRFKWLPVAATGVAVGLAFAVFFALYFDSLLLSVAICFVPTLVSWQLSRLWCAQSTRPGLR
jgi:hypothetical protein